MVVFKYNDSVLSGGYYGSNGAAAVTCVHASGIHAQYVALQLLGDDQLPLGNNLRLETDSSSYTLTTNK